MEYNKRKRKKRADREIKDAKLFMFRIVSSILRLPKSVVEIKWKLSSNIPQHKKPLSIYTLYYLGHFSSHHYTVPTGVSKMYISLRSEVQYKSKNLNSLTLMPSTNIFPNVCQHCEFTNKKCFLSSDDKWKKNNHILHLETKHWFFLNYNLGDCYFNTRPELIQQWRNKFSWRDTQQESPHLSIESYTVVASEQPFLWVHHLCHLQVRTMDIVVKLWQSLRRQTHVLKLTQWFSNF